MKFEIFLENKQLKEIAKKAGINIEGIDFKQLKMGMKIEKEHDKDKDTDVIPGHDKESIMKIAVAHLREIPDYYTRLKAMEKKAKQ